MKIAAVHMDTILGDVEANMKNAKERIKEAKDNNAELIVFPEFFTTGFAFSDKLYDAVLKYENPQKKLNEWAKEFNIIIGGSYLDYKDDDVYNTFTLTFPDGSIFRHCKDIPTIYEHFIYTVGDENKVFETEIGNIGTALCWEQIRYNTYKSMAGKVDFILTGSCWWGFSSNDMEQLQKLNKLSNELAVNAPIELAKRLKVPVIHASHKAEFEGVTFPDKSKKDIRRIYGATQIIDADGKVIVRKNYDDEAGIIIADIEYDINKRPDIKIDTDKYWVPDMPELFLKGWKYMLPKVREYYDKVTKPIYNKKL